MVRGDAAQTSHAMRGTSFGRSSGLLLCCAATRCLTHVFGAVTGHFGIDCGPDELTGEVQGQTGTICSPPCKVDTLACPSDVPPGTMAQPQCILQDQDQKLFCGLLCIADSQCPSGDMCRVAGIQGLGVCMHPLSFYDWASGSSKRRKLAVGLPIRPGQASSQGFQIAKAYTALQSLKKRYAIDDSDPDTLSVRELLAAMTVADQRGTAAAATSGGARPGGGGGILGAWEQDLSIFEKNMAGGPISGLYNEAASVVWNVENIERENAASGLLRGFLELAAAYVFFGGIYKHFALGEKGMDMIPHISFWREYPDLVKDGIKYSLQIVGGSAGGRLSGGIGGGGSSSRSGGNFQPMGRDSDTFGHFEPGR